MSKKEVVVLRYKSASPFYYRESQENEQFEQKAQNFEPPIHYVVQQKATTHGIIVSKGFELVFVTKQKTIVLRRAKPIT